jgi:LacI family transcriptional regulator
MPVKKARLKDIAYLSGVSLGTVDRVLHGRGQVAEKTSRIVQNIAKELNYTPNLVAQALKSKKRFNLASLLPESTSENTFWEKHPVGMNKAIAELNPFPVTLNQVTFDMLSEASFQKRASEVLSLHPDGVLLAPIFKAESIEFCKKLKNKKIPFVFVDGFIKETDYLAYIGEDIFRSGKVAGQLIDMVTPSKKGILAVNIAKNLQNVHHLNNRTQGFLSYFNGSGRNSGTKITLNIPDAGNARIKMAMDKVLKKNPDIGSVFVSGSKSYKIAQYFDDECISSINLIGYDLLEDNISYLKSGYIKFLIGQRPEEQTYKGIKKLFEYLSLNKVPDKMEYLPIDIVTSENFSFFL